jgi:hypothetical protein
MRKFNFGQAFRCFGIVTMGGRGTPWCTVNANGVMVLMTHKNYYRKFKIGNEVKYKYIDPGCDSPSSAPSVQISLDELQAYFDVGNQIILIEAEFTSDGGGGNPASFSYATGKCYNAHFVAYDRQTGRIECDIINSFALNAID